MVDEKRCVRLREAAELCRVSMDTVRQWAKEDAIPLTRTEDALWIDRRDLRSCLSRRGLAVPRSLEQWPRVLIADDDADMRRVADWLVHYAWKDAAVCTAADGELARQILYEFRPDLFVTDLRMPGKAGTELCRMVRSSPELAHTKILVITGYDDSRNREDLMGYVDGYLAKPFEPRELRDIAFRLLGPAPAEQAERSRLVPGVIF